MITSPFEALEELDHLPPVGTPERLEWDDTIRQANELYPDWASIRVGHARLSRAAYEKRHDEPDEEAGPSPSRLALPGPHSRQLLLAGTPRGGGGSPDRP
jgi:hypothetical protein